ncbi:MAG: hypothetical protein QOF61_827, partial [Acidobacteriota bacterium]|nr:hypothetical protein [Acidobacteriota bacterium]
VVWVTGGQVLRLGELRRDGRGNAAFEFAHPGGFDSYSVIVTAEADAQSERPSGSPVFSTRAGEVSALYPTKIEPRVEVSASDAAGESASRARTVTTLPARASSSPRASSAPRAAEFYESIDAAVEDSTSARTLALTGEDGARAASAVAKVATRDGTAYVRVRFRGVPLPARFHVRKYVMWAQLPEDGTLFLRALPARGLNRRTTYARRRNVNADNFQLLVTAERSYPHPRPRGRRVLITR